MKYLLQNIHKIAGTVLSLLFCMWFLSGFVMIYHPFPGASTDERLSKYDYLTPPAAELQTVWDSLGRVYSLSSYMDEPVFRAQKGTFDAASLTPHQAPTIDGKHIRAVANQWCKADILKIDTLTDIDQWIPTEGYLAQMPIYKFHFADKAKHQLYIDSKRGDVIQFTNCDNRFWAWLGAIPHWVYFTQLRRHSKVWFESVYWSSGIGSVMIIAGMYWGIRNARLFWKRKRSISPYKKRWIRWHHLFGLLFGIFIFTFAFSGMMSMANTSKWFKMTETDTKATRAIIKAPTAKDFKLDYRKVIAAHPNKIRQMTWRNFANHTFYHLTCDGETLYIDASTNDKVEPLNISEAEITALIRSVHGTDAKLTTEWLQQYDTYYVKDHGDKVPLGLPVYKISVDNNENSCYYINPTTGHFRHINDAARYRHWLYPGLHTLRFGFLVNRPWLWTVVMWTTLLGGTVVSITGLYLSVRYLKRQTRNIKRKNK